MNDILSELSWSLKVKLLKEMNTPAGTTNQNPSTTAKPQPPPPDNSSNLPKRKIAAPKRRTMNESHPNEAQDDDANMKIKLFRLMYETVKDSDLKVKRAELIKNHYANVSAFNVGFLMGDITDRMNVVSDITLTLRRFHKEWKPIEHINAYEQIANHAIEITNTIDMIRVVNKKHGVK